MHTSAPELHNSIKKHNLPKLGAFITGAGTGGTIMGFHHYFSVRDDDFTAFPVFPVNNVDGDKFEVNLIPYTLDHTTWKNNRKGDRVNIEVDILSRYVLNDKSETREIWQK